MFTSAWCSVKWYSSSQDIAFCVSGRFRRSFISSWRGPGLWKHETLTAHSELTGVLLGRQWCQTLPVFFMLWVIALYMLTLADVKCSGRQKCFEGTWLANIITYKQDGYQAHAISNITLSESACRLYLGEMPPLWFSLSSVTRAVKQESAPHIMHSLTD